MAALFHPAHLAERRESQGGIRIFPLERIVQNGRPLPERGIHGPKIHFTSRGKRPEQCDVARSANFRKGKDPFANLRTSHRTGSGWNGASDRAHPLADLLLGSTSKRIEARVSGVHGGSLPLRDGNIVTRPRQKRPRCRKRSYRIARFQRMQFSCAQCSTKYAVPDEKVRGKRIRTKCRKCGAEIVVDGPGVPSIAPGSKAPASASGAVAASPAAREEEKWTVALDRATQKKMTTSEVAEAYARGEIVDATLVWKQGMTGWQAPFEIPAIALALRAKGLEKGRGPKGAAPASPATSAKDTSGGVTPAWDDENEATRVVDGALAFPGRPAPAARAAPVVKPPVPARPAPPAPPAPPAASGFEEDEATRVVAPKEAQDLLAPISAKAPVAPTALTPAAPQPARSAKAIFKTQLGLAPPLPVPARPPPGPAAAPRTLPVREAPPPVPAKPISVTPAPVTPRAPLSAPAASSMNFDDEATAVIAPDRARELLENEAAKSGKEPTETPMGVAFDDEATRVVSQERPAPVPVARAKPDAGAAKPASRPEAAAPRASLATTKNEVAKEAPKAVPEPAGSVPSIVLTEPKPQPKMPVAPDATLAKATPSARDLSTLALEKTRVVPRAAKKNSSGTLFWITLTIALAAAAIGGFVASRLVDGQKLPSWMHLP